VCVYVCVCVCECVCECSLLSLGFELHLRLVGKRWEYVCVREKDIMQERDRVRERLVERERERECVCARARVCVCTVFFIAVAYGDIGGEGRVGGGERRK